MAIQSELKKQLENRFSDRVRFDEPMANHTTFRVGGPADVFITVTDERELTWLVKWLKENEQPFFIVGGGTNLLVKDKGIRGVVICLAKELATISQYGSTILSAMAGAGLSSLCRFAIKQGLAGLNFALGIPGTVGGAIRMNAGAGKDDMRNVLDSIRIINSAGSIEVVDKRELTFSYRSFSFAGETRMDLSSAVIIEGRFSLSPQRPDLLKVEADELLNTRKKTQPAGFASAGCFFKNPENRESAGKLIDLAGGKGCRVGDAQVSSKHANFIVNRGRATAEDIIQLMGIVQESVFKKFNIMLEPEVKIVGD